MIPHRLISGANEQEKCENFLQSANKLTSASKLGQRALMVLVWKVLALTYHKKNFCDITTHPTSVTSSGT